MKQRSTIPALAIFALLFFTAQPGPAQFCGPTVPPWPDGCSIGLPQFVQNGLNGIFFNACNNHDVCWAQLNDPWGPCLGLGHKAQCDFLFLAHMEAACLVWAGALSFPGSGWVDAGEFLDDCEAVAGTFYVAVNTSFGFLIYNNSQCCRGCNTNTCNLLGLVLPSQCFGACGSGGPGPCNSSFEQTETFALDLESGRILHPSQVPTPGLTRSETVDGESYFLEEWTVAEMATDGSWTVLDASAPTQVLSAVHTSALRDTPGVGLGRRYLVVEAARHIRGIPAPLIRLESLELGNSPASRLQDGRVTFRASFTPGGDLENVQVLEGNRRTARLLAEDLRVELPLAREDPRMRHEGHRAVVFATFEVSAGRPRFVSAIPVLPQCCCDTWPTCPV